jgi:nitric-oxide synthase, bacterial
MTLRIRLSSLGVSPVFRLPSRVNQPPSCRSGAEESPGSGAGGGTDVAPRNSSPRLSSPSELLAQANRFLQECYAELDRKADLDARLEAVAESIARTGTYDHTFEELEYGAQVAWRNSSRCIGRLYWRSLRLRDRRHVTTPGRIAAECVDHLREATNGGRVRPLITVFAPDRPDGTGPRIHNEQLIRYAGYRLEGPEGPDGAKGAVIGDPRNIAITDTVRRLGWYGHGTAFDVLPLLIDAPGHRPYLHVLPHDAVSEVPLSHPAYPWFAELGLRWHAVPVISDMGLEIGGLHYGCAPFNGWYMGTEIGSRNLADTDRYDLLPSVAAALGLDTSTDRSLWRDRALVELNVAVLHSYDLAGVTITDHHTESHRFLTHVEKEEKAGRTCPADWSWIVPPLSGGSTAVFHRYYDEAEDPEAHPNFVRHAAHGAEPTVE